MFDLHIGNAFVRIALPDSAQSAMLPAYLRSFSGDVLPRFEADVSLDFLRAAPKSAVDVPDEFGFHRARMERRDDTWRFFTEMPVGPARPDALPTRHVIPAVLAVLAAHGVMAIHASAVLHAGKALIFAGPSGSGKSTSADECTKAGCAFFADDRVLAWCAGDDVMMTPSFELGNPFTRWVGHVPEFGDRRPPPKRPTPFGSSAPVGGIFFPEIRPDEGSRVEPMAATEAFVRLAASSTGAWELPPIRTSAQRLVLGLNPERAMEAILRCVRR